MAEAVLEDERAPDGRDYLLELDIAGDSHHDANQEVSSMARDQAEPGDQPGRARDLHGEWLS